MDISNHLIGSRLLVSQLSVALSRLPDLWMSCFLFHAVFVAPRHILVVWHKDLGLLLSNSFEVPLRTVKIGVHTSVLLMLWTLLLSAPRMVFRFLFLLLWLNSDASLAKFGINQQLIIRRLEKYYRLIWVVNRCNHTVVLVVQDVISSPPILQRVQSSQCRSSRTYKSSGLAGPCVLMVKRVLSVGVNIARLDQIRKLL